MTEKPKTKMSFLCLMLTVFNFIGIWFLIVLPYVLPLFGIVLPITPPVHLIDVTLFLVALACGVGVKSIADMFIAFVNRGRVINEDPKE